MKTSVGLMLVVRNEAHRIEACLRYHLPYVDEVAICDQSSEDGTFEIVKKLQGEYTIPFHVWQDKNWGFCEPSKQKTADLLNTEWLLYVDPDEKFPLSFLRIMKQLLAVNDYNGYNFPRNNYFDVQVFDENVPIEPKWLTVKHPKKDSQLRLTKKSVSTFPALLHHRVRITGRACDLYHAIEHRKTVNEQWEDNKRYDIINKK